MHNPLNHSAIKEDSLIDGFSSPIIKADLGCEGQEFVLRPIVKTTQTHVKWGTKVFLVKKNDDEWIYNDLGLDRNLNCLDSPKLNGYRPYTVKPNKFSILWNKAHPYMANESNKQKRLPNKNISSIKGKYLDSPTDSRIRELLKYCVK